MANIAHASLTGSSLHEPKGVATATAGQVYIANGLGTGTWQTVAGLTFTGMLAPFSTPIAPTGWLECDGSLVSKTTYSDLYNAVTIQQTGNTVNGLAIVTGLSSTVNMRAGYYVFGTGIAAGTTIATVDSSTQITLNAVSTATGSTSVHVSPWLINATQLTLPNLTDQARFVRSRSSAVQAGTYLSSQNKAHDHGGASASGAAVITSSNENVLHTHEYAGPPTSQVGQFTGPGGSGWSGGSVLSVSTFQSTLHTHNVTLPDHTHPIPSEGGSEARPLSMVALWCVKT